MHVQFSGRYRLQVFHGDTDILLQDTGWFDNLITNNGLDLLGLGFIETCYVGSDAGTPTEGDTSITSILATSSSSSVVGRDKQLSTAPYYSWEQTAFTFGIGAIVGTIHQVAVGASSTNLFSKALLTTTDGTPTTLTLGGIDRLVLTYELRQCISTADVTGNIDINGTTYAYTGRPCDLDYSAFWNISLGSPVGGYDYSSIKSITYLGATALGTVLTRPNGTGVNSRNSGSDNYVAGTYRRSMWELWDTVNGNLTDMRAFLVVRYNGSFSGDPGNGGAWQFLLDAGVNKTQYQNFRLEWEYSWGRCT